MVNVFNSVDEYIKTLDKRIEKLKKPKSVKLAATYCMNVAKKLAPHKTGETISGIRKRKLKKQEYSVISAVAPKGKTGFMQNFWADSQEPFRSPRMVWNKGNPTPFPNKKGKGFFTNASTMTRKRFNELAVSEVNTVIKSR